MSQFKNKTFEGVWKELGDIPVNEHGEIDEPFMEYDKGTDCNDIWHDLEDYFNISIGDYLSVLS